MQSFIADKNEKLSAALPSKTEGISYSLLMKLLRKKDIKVNGARIKTDILLNIGDKVEIYSDGAVITYYNEIYKDENILVVDKTAGVESEKVFSKISEKYPSAGFIHRLDRNTSGIMVFSLNQVAEKELLGGFKSRAFDKIYIAEVVGNMPKEKDTLKAYLFKDAENSSVKIFDKKTSGAVEIKTGYKVVGKTTVGDILEVRLYTGKTHQIRAHLAHTGHFIVGDGKYGDGRINAKLGVKKQRLTAYSITLRFDAGSPLYYLDGKTFKLKRKVY